MGRTVEYFDRHVWYLPDNVRLYLIAIASVVLRTDERRVQNAYADDTFDISTVINYSGICINITRTELHFNTYQSTA
jgi:hypothetical protein